MQEKKAEQNQEKRYFKSIYIIIAVLSLLILLNSLNRFFAHDEFEHIHSAWYIEQGYTPYVDFFQSHHPLLWYMMIPFLILLGHNISTIIVLRLFSLLFTAGIVILVYRLARLAVPAKEVALLAVVFLLSMVMFVEKGIEIRPDVPQVFFGLLSLYFLLKALPPVDKSKREYRMMNNEQRISQDQKLPKHSRALTLGTLGTLVHFRHFLTAPCAAGFFAAVSFLFLQKSIVLLAAFGIIFVHKLIKKEISWKAVTRFGLFFFLPLLLFAAYLLVTRSFSDYLVTNWLFHIHHIKSFFPGRIVIHSLVQNFVFWIFAIPGVLLILFRKNKNRELRLISGLAFFLLLSIFLMKHPYRQNFILPISLLSIAAGYIAKFIFFKFRYPCERKTKILVLFILVPLIFMCFMGFNSNRSQLERITFVLENTKITDVVYDGDIKFNLFRPDLHYFWYAIRNGGLATYNKISNNRFADYDAVKLIRSQKPELISDFFLDIEKSRLSKFYEKTPYKKLYIKKKPAAGLPLTSIKKNLLVEVRFSFWIFTAGGMN